MSLSKIKHISECRSVTDSVGSYSDISTHTMQSSSTMTKSRMEVVCIIDVCQNENLLHRKKALDEVRNACNLIGANLIHTQVGNLVS